MKTYYQNGTSNEYPYFIDDEAQFAVQVLDDNGTNKFIYSGDYITFELDLELALLYNKFRDLYFSNTNNYYAELKSLPVFVQCAGQDSALSISSDDLTVLMDKCIATSPNLIKHMYLVDCQFLVGAIQNHLAVMQDCLCNYYVNLCSIDYHGKDFENTTVMASSVYSRQLSGTIETYFTKAYSILDILCKISFEFENPMRDFSTYKKMKCSDVLWGARKKLNINKVESTVFEDCEIIRMIESIRNEVVHNGTWELNPKVFLSMSNGKVIERYIFFPDFSKGHLATVKNRKHFFSSGLKVNDILPVIHREYMQRVLNTVKHLNAYAITN